MLKQNKIYIFLWVMIILLTSCVRNEKVQLNQEIINSQTEEQILESNNIINYVRLFGEEIYLDLIELVNEFEIHCSNENISIYWNDLHVNLVLYYEGSTIPPADMLFFSNSIMMLRSKFDSQNLDTLRNRYFLYLFNGNDLTIKSIDSRDNVQRWLETEKWHMTTGRGNILSIDEINNTVVYNYRERIQFGGLYYYK